MPHPDLQAEQAHLDRALARLEAVRAQTQEQLKEAFRERGGTFQSFTERDIRVRHSLNRLEKLELGRESLIFGRIDAIGPAYPPGAGRRSWPGLPTWLGTAQLSRSAHCPDRGGQRDGGELPHRAPGAFGRRPRTAGGGLARAGGRAFLPGHGRPPHGLAPPPAFPHRRVGTVLDIEDELFAPGGSEGAAETLGLSGSSVLMAALSRAHTGRMRDIVATVQAEQDEIIRAPLAGVLVVQGGPGTGKTAVALHRAAYLLYTHRFPLEGQGVLVVGPNPTFLRYIDQVLPSLGETGVELSTATGLYRGARPTATESPATARLKGDPRMARFVRRAVHQRERPLRKAVQIPYGRWALTLTPEASAEIVAAAKRRSGLPQRAPPHRGDVALAAPVGAGDGTGGEPGRPDPSRYPGRRRGARRYGCRSAGCRSAGCRSAECR
jgi:hypothetical protein